MCFYCGDDLPDYDTLRKHTKSHGLCTDKDRAVRLVKSGDAEVKIDVSDITCEICHESFANFDEIVSHLMIKHKLPYNKDIELILTAYRLVDLKCLQCEERFKYFTKLITHVNTHHPSNCFLCEMCNLQFNKKSDLRAHVRTQHKTRYSCSKCSLSFDTNALLRSHKNSHMSACNICLDTFSSTNKRLRHMKNEHNFDGVLQCGLCLQVSQTKQGFLRHAAKCNMGESKPMLVDEVEKETRPVKALRNNIACIFNMSTAIPFKHFMNRFRCFYCPKDFTECDDLKQHTVMEHPLCDIKLKSMKLRNRKNEGIKVDISSLSCKLCFESMSDLDVLIDHIIKEHKANYDKSIPSLLQPFKLIKGHFSCPFCGSACTYFTTLLKHINKDHSDNRHICVYCGESFRNDPNLRSHISRYHSTARYKCNLCDSEFTSKKDLQLHSGRKHGVKVVNCPQCPEKFVSQYRMNRHLIDAHGTGHKCSHCGRMFTKHSFMMSHVRRLHLKEKNVQCSVCSERFFDRQRLKMHMIKHIGERNFHCDFCGKKFLWKKNLRGHMASHIKHANAQD